MFIKTAHVERSCPGYTMCVLALCWLLLSSLFLYYFFASNSFLWCVCFLCNNERQTRLLECSLASVHSWKEKKNASSRERREKTARWNFGTQSVRQISLSRLRLCEILTILKYILTLDLSKNWHFNYFFIKHQYS